MPSARVLEIDARLASITANLRGIYSQELTLMNLLDEATWDAVREDLTEQIAGLVEKRDELHREEAELLKELEELEKDQQDDQ